MANTILIILRMADWNQPHMDKLYLMVLMIDDHIRMPKTNLNDEYYFTPLPELEDDEH